jgi:AcrR family transcriptional regulator
MGRAQGRSDELLDRAVEHLQSVGLERFSLASLATALGTSSRMLIYHLGSRDEILGKVQATMRLDVTNELRARHFDNVTDAFQATWDFYVARLSHMELFFHLVSRSFEEPEKMREFTDSVVSAWTDFFGEVAEREGYGPAETEAVARLAIDVFRGLILDLSLTGDLKRTSRSVKLFAKMLSANSPAG